MILITDSRKDVRLAYAEMFYYMGILSETREPNEVLSAVTGECSAVLYTSLSGIENAQLLAEEQKLLSGLPFYAISDDECHVFDMTFPTGMLSSSIARAIASHQRQIGIREIGSYHALGIDACVESGEVSYLGNPLDLTKTEKMIIRYLLRAYPKPVLAEEVLKHAFRQSRLPEISSVRTHISIINKKFRKMFGRSLASVENGLGYVISLGNAAEVVDPVSSLLYS